jgi:hypothetical protein
MLQMHWKISHVSSYLVGLSFTDLHHLLHFFRAPAGYLRYPPRAPLDGWQGCPAARKGLFFTRQLTGWLMPKIALKLLDSCLFFVHQACNTSAPKWRITCSIHA